MIDSYGNHINFAKMLSWYEIIAKDKFDFKAFYCADYLLHKEIFLTEKDAQDYVSTNLRSKKNFMQIDKVQRPISSRMVKLFNILFICIKINITQNTHPKTQNTHLP